MKTLEYQVYMSLPYDIWISYQNIPEGIFQYFFRIIDEPLKRPGDIIMDNDDMTCFMKKKQFINQK